MLRQPRPLVPFAFPFGGRSYLQRILNTQKANLIALWGLGETTGSTAANAEGTSARDGSYVNGVSINATTFSDGTPAPSFDGSNDVVNVYSSSLASAINANEGTLALWVNVDAAIAATGRIAAFLNSGGEGIRWSFLTSNSAQLGRQQSSTQKIITVAVTRGTWIHLALTWSATANQLIGYVNGVAGTPDTAPTITSFTLGTTNASVGAANSTGSIPFRGFLKYAALWSTALSASEIAALAAV